MEMVVILIVGFKLDGFVFVRRGILGLLVGVREYSRLYDWVYGIIIYWYFLVLLISKIYLN